MYISIIVGTRPEIIKMSPIIKECIEKNIDYFILHTGQHYSYNMDRVFFEQLNLPEASYNLDIGSGTHAEQTGNILINLEKILSKEKPEIVLVEGDTNTVLAGALAATKINIKVGHVESGLRSYDRSMPEETNRVITDHISDLLFAPTEKSKNILISEGIDKHKIFVTGNTIVDAVYQNLKIADEKVNVLKKYSLKKQNYFLATIHRQENVDNENRFKNIINGLNKVSETYKLPMIYPIHPRARKMMERFNLQNDKIKLIDPIDYLSFLQLENNAKLVLTDSGGVQEETCILNVPCVTLRDNTERPETIEIGSNILAGINQEKILECVKIMVENDKKWKNPFGDGKSGKKIIKIIGEEFS